MSEFKDEENSESTPLTAKGDHSTASNEAPRRVSTASKVGHTATFILAGVAVSLDVVAAVKGGQFSMEGAIGSAFSVATLISLIPTCCCDKRGPSSFLRGANIITTGLTLAWVGLSAWEMVESLKSSSSVVFGLQVAQYAIGGTATALAGLETIVACAYQAPSK